MNALRNAWDWTMVSPYRSWLAHCLIALALAPIFGTWAIMVFYILREGEQVVTTWFLNFKQDWTDHFFDLSAPFVALALASVLGWGV